MDPFVSTLAVFSVLDFTVQWLACLVSAFLQTEVFFDLVGSCTFLLGACLSLALGGVFHERQVLLTTLVAVWAVRLGTFLFMRILQVGKDSRFDGVRTQPLILFAYWTIQGLWVFLVLMPLLLLNVSRANEHWPQPSDICGLGLWGAGFLFETVADYQKFLFRLDEKNKDKWIESGLWRLCQHPNYFGEIVLWWGVYLAAYAGLPSVSLRILGAVSPLFTMYTLLFMSGIPLLEHRSMAKWGASKSYLAYRRRTPRLVPKLLSWSISAESNSARKHEN